VPETPIILRVPPRCPHCNDIGRIRLQQALKGVIIRLEWLCPFCNFEWFVCRKDEQKSA